MGFVVNNLVFIGEFMASQRGKFSVKPFSKGLRSGEAEPPKTAFLFLAFLCASFCQRKAANDLDFLCGEVNKGNPHLCVPLFRLRRNSPFVALSDAMRVSVSAETDHRSARWTSGLFLKKETQKLSAMSRRDVSDKSKFERGNYAKTW